MIFLFLFFSLIISSQCNNDIIIKPNKYIKSIDYSNIDYSVNNSYIYPKAEQNQTRAIINFIDCCERDNTIIEINFYKQDLIDKYNLFFYKNEITKKYVKGWGYNYYVITYNNIKFSTFIRTDKDEEFIGPIYFTETLKISYNYLLPLVIYYPNEVNFIYRVWKSNNYYYN